MLKVLLDEKVTYMSCYSFGVSTFGPPYLEMVSDPKTLMNSVLTKVTRWLINITWYKTSALIIYEIYLYVQKLRYFEMSVISIFFLKSLEMFASYCDLLSRKSRLTCIHFELSPRPSAHTNTSARIICYRTNSTHMINWMHMLLCCSHSVVTRKP